MTWFPIGPDFIYTPRDSATPQRISRRDMYARQCQIWGITVDPTRIKRGSALERGLIRVSR